MHPKHQGDINSNPGFKELSPVISQLDYIYQNQPYKMTGCEEEIRLGSIGKRQITITIYRASLV